MKGRRVAIRKLSRPSLAPRNRSDLVRRLRRRAEQIGGASPVGILSQSGTRVPPTSILDGTCRGIGTPNASDRRHDLASSGVCRWVASKRRMRLVATITATRAMTPNTTRQDELLVNDSPNQVKANT